MAGCKGKGRMKPREWFIVEDSNGEGDAFAYNDSCVHSEIDIHVIDNSAYLELQDVMTLQNSILNRSRDQLVKELAEARSLLKDHQDDWKRIQDAERNLEANQKAFETKLAEKDTELDQAR